MPSACTPTKAVHVQFTVTPPESRSGTCTVVAQGGDGVDLYQLSLDCDGEPVVIDVDSTILLDPMPGESVALDYRAQAQPWGEDRWLAIHQIDGYQGLVLGAVSAASLDPPGSTLAALFVEPVLSVAAEQPCEASADACVEQRRLALDVSTTLLGRVGAVLDHSSWWADILAYGYAIELEHARAADDSLMCPEPDPRFELMVVWFPPDAPPA